MLELAISLILVALSVLGVCFFHGIGVCIMRLWNQRTGRREFQIVRRGR